MHSTQMEKACDLCHITLNKNAVVGDVSAMTPGGVRIGTPAMTSRGLKEQDFERVAELLHQVVLLCKEVQGSSGKMLKAFNRYEGAVGWVSVCTSSTNDLCAPPPNLGGGCAAALPGWNNTRQHP